jgi:hypothetical protein
MAAFAEQPVLLIVPVTVYTIVLFGMAVTVAVLVDESAVDGCHE